MNEITVRVKHVYGKELIYPVCDKATIFSDIAGTTTLTRETLERVKALGYKIRVTQQEVNL